jgi:hypothetical protein
MPRTTADTFTNYLRTQRHREDRVGDFAREWFTDGGAVQKPRGRYSWGAVRAYLESNDACEDAILAGRKAWAEWSGTPSDPGIFVLPELLMKHGLIDRQAITDAENYDGGATAAAVRLVISDLAAACTPPID